MDNIKLDQINLGDVKTRGQQEADKLLATGEYMTTFNIANRYGISRMTAREKMVYPDKACGGGQKIFLYSRQRVEAVMGKLTTGETK
jgi:hypothetical protein